jgi:glucuronate isomerase
MVRHLTKMDSGLGSDFATPPVGHAVGFPVGHAGWSNPSPRPKTSMPSPISAPNRQDRPMRSTREAILQSLRAITLIDPHTHINPHSPASTTLADLLGYHYYTELAHASGMPKSDIESSASPRELVRRLVGGLEHLTNTAQFGWLIEICQQLYGFEHDSITADNWESLYERAESVMASADWATTVLEKSNVAAVFLTNDFDDPLERFDTGVYIPCLRTDDLVFHLAKPQVRERLAAASGVCLDGSLSSLRESLDQRFRHFVSRGARACAISLPPDFSPMPVSDGRAATALDAVCRHGATADPAHRSALARRIFWTLAELCDHYGLPFDLMIGVNRDVYREGVYQGRDLYDSRVSLIQYAELFNAFPGVKFPVSVLASVTNQELVSYAWIFPNVITSGHWWYSNTPAYIRRDAAARLEAVPRNKQIAYYSDAYKLEFIAPKFDMYRQTLADILTEDFVVRRRWSEEKAIELGYQVLRGNVERIFPSLAAGKATPVPLPCPVADTIHAWETTESPETPVAAEDLDALNTIAGPEAFDALEMDEADETLGLYEATEAQELSDAVEAAHYPETIDLPETLDPTEATDLPKTIDFSEPIDLPEKHDALKPVNADETLGVLEWPDEPESIHPADRWEIGDHQEDVAERSAVSLVPDPVTGELTWPTTDSHDSSDDDAADEPELELAELPEASDFEVGSQLPDDLLESLKTGEFGFDGEPDDWDDLEQVADSESDSDAELVDDFDENLDIDFEEDRER